MEKFVVVVSGLGARSSQRLCGMLSSSLVPRDSYNSQWEYYNITLNFDGSDAYYVSQRDRSCSVAGCSCVKLLCTVRFGVCYCNDVQSTIVIIFQYASEESITTSWPHGEVRKDLATEKLDRLRIVLSSFIQLIYLSY